MKTLGPDFVYGVISSMDGERDPRNLMFLFAFLPNFIKHIPLGHLVEEMFEVISCYYPIDFHPSPDDPAAVSRQDLAMVLAPCLCATQEFAEHCLVLLIEKLDSSLRLAKIDSLKLLVSLFFILYVELALARVHSMVVLNPQLTIRVTIMRERVRNTQVWKVGLCSAV